MAVYRVQRTRDYTVMSNYHLKDKGLTLKSKGLLSMILSLPEEWNYTTRGLASICKEGVDAIGSALKELETAGYIVRRQLRGANGRITDTEYIIYEQPQPKKLDMLPSDVVSPDTENPDMVKPDTEKPAELNIEKSNTEKSITYGSSTDSIPFRETAAARPPERKGRDAMSVTEIENYRELILENIEYALNKIMEKMGLLIHYGNGWGTTDAGAKFSMWHKGVLNSDSWHPELVDEIAKFLKK